MTLVPSWRLFEVSANNTKSQIIIYRYLRISAADLIEGLRTHPCSDEAEMMTELEKLYDRLGTRNIPGTEAELKILAKRIDELARLKGEEWILENRESLLKQWDWTRCYLNSASN